MRQLTKFRTLAQLVDLAATFTERGAAVAHLETMATDIDGRQTHWSCPADMRIDELVLCALLARNAGAFYLFIEHGERFPRGVGYINVESISSTISWIVKGLKTGRCDGWSFYSLLSGIAHNTKADIPLNMQLLAGVTVTADFLRSFQRCADSSYSEEEENFPGSAEAVQNRRVRNDVVSALGDYISKHKWRHSNCWHLRSVA